MPQLLVKEQYIQSTVNLTFFQKYIYVHLRYVICITNAGTPYIHIHTLDCLLYCVFIVYKRDSKIPSVTVTLILVL